MHRVYFRRRLLWTWKSVNTPFHQTSTNASTLATVKSGARLIIWLNPFSFFFLVFRRNVWFTPRSMANGYKWLPCLYRALLNVIASMYPCDVRYREFTGAHGQQFTHASLAVHIKEQHEKSYVVIALSLHAVVEWMYVSMGCSLQRIHWRARTAIHTC